MPKNKDMEYRYIKAQIRLIIKSIINTLKNDLEQQVYQLSVPQKLISSKTKSLQLKLSCALRSQKNY